MWCGEAKLNLEVPELGAPLHRIAEMLRMTAAAKAVLLLCAIALLAAGSGAAGSERRAQPQHHQPLHISARRDQLHYWHLS